MLFAKTRRPGEAIIHLTRPSTASAIRRRVNPATAVTYGTEDVIASKHHTGCAANAKLGSEDKNTLPKMVPESGAEGM